MEVSNVTFLLRGRVPSSHWIGGWEGLTAVLVMVEKRKNLFLDPAGN
jgi:hypothetical protein